MEKKLYLVPVTEIVSIEEDNFLCISGGPTYSGKEDEIGIGTPTTPDPDKPIEF